MWRGGSPPQNNNIKVRLQNQDEKRNNERVLETGSSSYGINCSSCWINSAVEVSGVWRMVNFIYASVVSSTGVMVQISIHIIEPNKKEGGLDGTSDYEIGDGSSYYPGRY